MSKRIAIKLFAKNPDVIDTAEFVPIFQRWIQQSTISGLLIDVVDYKHVPAGPGVILIGHEFDLNYDLRDNRPGLQLTYKQFTPDQSLAERVTLVFHALLDAVARLEEDDAAHGLQIDTTAAEIVLLDRLNYPNNRETFAGLQPELEELGRALYGQPVTVTHASDDSRQPLTVTLSAPEAVTASDLLQRRAVTG